MNELTTIEDPNELLRSILSGDYEVGMLEMGKGKNSFPVPDTFIPFGKFECDTVAIDKKTNEIVMLDHEVSGRVMSQVAFGIKEFVSALSLIYDYFESDEVFDEDETKMKQVAEAASSRAGGEKYQKLWHMFFGV